MVTRGPAARVRALLDLVRPVAAEIVLAVDAQGDTTTLDLCADLADRSYQLEVGTPPRVYGWLMHECTADWIFRLDDDEVLSAELLAELPSLLHARHPTCIALARRWLYRDRRHFITSHPWTPDYQPRLVRNVPGIWRFPGMLHTDFGALGEHRFLPLPIYHLDLVLHSLEARADKRDRYEAERAGHASDGFPVNAMYTPEDLENVEVSRVPEADAELIDRVCHAEYAGASPGRSRPRRVDAREVERFFPQRQLSPAAYSAAIRFARAPRSMGAGETQVVELEVENKGEDWWPAGDQMPAVRVAHRWLGIGESALGSAPRTALPETLAPGSKTRVLVHVRAPVWAGRHSLQVDLVHEGARWFGTPVEQVVEVWQAIDRVALGSPPPAPDGRLAAEVTPSSSQFTMVVGERGPRDVRVRNRGTRSWDSSGRGAPPIRVSCRWIDEGGTVVVTDAPRTPLPSPVGPGEEAVVPLDLAAPVRPGRYTIEVDLVEEGIRWFGKPAPVAVEVSAPAEVRQRLSRARQATRGPRARLRRRRARSIPHSIHRIWLGDQPLPEEFRYYGETWARHHPGWKVRLWGEREAARLIPLSARRLCRSHSETSNLLRYEILRRVGGIYADTDVECRRPIDQLLHGVDALAAWETPYRLGSAVLGSVPGHAVFELAAREARVTVGTGLHSAEGTGPGLLTQIVAEQPSIAVFESELFYPYKWDQRHRRNEPFPDSYCVHHYALSWTAGAGS